MRRVCDLNKLECNVSYHYHEACGKNLLFHVNIRTVTVWGRLNNNGYGNFYLCLSLLFECIGFYLKVLGLTWGVWDSSMFSLQPTIILGADVLYDSNGENMGCVCYLSVVTFLC